MTKNLRDSKDDAQLRSELSHIANVYFCKYKPTKSALRKHGILKKLKNNSNIVIVKPDKGNAVVILDKVSYKNCMLKILSDNSKFKILREDTAIYREGQLQRRLLSAKKKGVFTVDEYKKIYPSGSKPARLYGLPKMHKTYIDLAAFRPILSSIGTFNYQLAAHFGHIIKDIIPKDYSCTDTFSFLQDVNKCDIVNKYTISYDVCSLFTNLPLEETLNLAVDLLLKKYTNWEIGRDGLYELLLFCTSKTNFLFDGVVYDQVDGIAMGSPLAPTLANLFLGHHEKNWLSEYEGVGPSFYRRYVDDIFAVFENKDDAFSFLEYINKKHVNLKFTKEESNNGKLDFLDVTINTNNELVTSVYHKPTFTGLLTNFRSFVPLDYKIKLITTLVDRAYKINNTWKGFDVDVKKIFNYLSRNLFPQRVIERNLKKYLDKKITGGNKDVKDNNILRSKQYMKLPYIGQYSIDTKKKLIKLYERFCKEDIDIRIVFSVAKVRDYFSTKDSFPECFKSYVVYLFKCANCGICYVGRTHKHLDTRIAEHFGGDKNSSVLNHLKGNKSCHEKATAEVFTILDHARTDYELAVKEGFHINWLKPALNKQKKHEVITLLV